jgi:hypothetical protein
MAVMHTNLPSRPRGEVTTYVVQPGDTIFGIAEMFNLRPQTILWGNFYILADNPHLLSPGQELNILPVDGTYHKWSAGEGLNGVAAGYRVDTRCDHQLAWQPSDRRNGRRPVRSKIEPGTWLVVPGGERDFVTWSAPRINREQPGSSQGIRARLLRNHRGWSSGYWRVYLAGQRAPPFRLRLLSRHQPLRHRYRR